ncbi:Fc receptor-like protein 5, partial [Silurus asotus]
DDVILESPVHPVTEGHPLTLRCLYRKTNPSSLRADFYKDGSVVQNQSTGEMIIYKVSKSDEGFYHCKHPERGESPRSWISVRQRPQTVLSVSPQNWLTEGDSVTLSCEVTDSSTDWTFSWYTVVPHRDGLTAKQNTHGFIMYVELFSDSSRGSGGNYSLSPSALHHTGVYVCRGERGEPAFHTLYSYPQPLWIS